MKQIKLLKLGILISLCWTVNGQFDPNIKELKFNELINNEFKTLLTGGQSTVPGKFAALDFLNGSFNLSTYFLFENGNRININATGRSLDGTLALLTNSKLNTGISLGVEYHFLKKSNNDFIALNHGELAKFEVGMSKINKNHKKQIEQLELEKELNIKSIKKEIDTLKNQVKRLEAKIPKGKDIVDEVKSELIKIASVVNSNEKEWLNDQIIIIKINDCKSLPCALALKETIVKARRLVPSGNLALRASVTALIKKTDKDFIEVIKNGIASKKASIAKKGNELESIKERNIKKLKYPLYAERDKKIKALNKSINAVYASSFGWISIGYSFTNSNFKLFDSEQTLASQIIDTSYISYQIKGQYSRYGWNKDTNGTYYCNLGGTLRVADNFNSLSKITVQDIVISSELDSTTRQSVSEFNAYQGKYFTDLAGGSIYSNFYQFFNNRKTGLHLNGNGQFLEDEKPIWSAEIGFILSFQNLKDKNANLNIELFYTFNDLSNSLNSDNNLFERNNIGLRLAAPLSF